MKGYSYKIIKNLFNHYPLGRAVMLIDNYLDIVVIRISTNCFNEDEYIHTYVEATPECPYGRNVLVPFNSEDYPNSEWVFFNEYGELVSKDIKPKLVYLDKIIGEFV